MNYWVRIMFLGVMSCLFMREMNEEVSSFRMEEICHESILSVGSDSRMSFEESSPADRLIRTINHILESIYADLSIPVCLIPAGVKDNNDNKSVLTITGGLQKDNMTYRSYNADAGYCHDCHNLIHSPKDYYIYTLEKIII